MTSQSHLGGYLVGKALKSRLSTSFCFEKSAIRSGSPLEATRVCIASRRLKTLPADQRSIAAVKARAFRVFGRKPPPLDLTLSGCRRGSTLDINATGIPLMPLNLNPIQAVHARHSEVQDNRS